MFENISQLVPSVNCELNEIAQLIQTVTHSDELTVPEKISSLRELNERMTTAIHKAERAYATLTEA